MPPAATVGEQTRTPTGGVGRGPPRRATPAGLAGPPLVVGDQPRHPLVGQVPRHEPRPSTVFGTISAVKMT